MKTIIHLLSGGIDSTVLLYDLVRQGHNVHCLLFNYGQKHAQELTFAKHHCREVDVLWTTIDLPNLRGSKLTDGSGSFVVPNRNGIMLSVAVNLAVAAGADTVTYACNADDKEMFPDCRPAFVEAMNQAIKDAGCDVEVCAPYIGKTKREIVEIGKGFGVNLNQTWSCYRGGANPCWTCPACVTRATAMSQ